MKIHHQANEDRTTCGRWIFLNAHNQKHPLKVTTDVKAVTCTGCTKKL